MPIRNRSSGLQLGLSCAAAVCIAACSQRAVEAPPAPTVLVESGRLHVPESSPLRSRLFVQEVESREAPHAFVVPATVEADPARTVSIVAPLSGRVIELKVGLGDRVARGQPLMVIASGDSAQAHTDVEKARDALDLARKQFERARAVKDAGGEASKDVETAQSAVVQTQAEFDRAGSRLASFGAASSGNRAARTITVIAPMSGSITTLAVAAGQFVNDTTATAMTLSNIDTVWVTASVPENQIGQIAKGQDADVALAAYPGETLRGSVQFVDDVLAADTRRGKVRIAFANPRAKLKPNMFATVTFSVAQPAQLFVPQSALLMNNDRTTVFVETAPWTFERRAITLGHDEGDAARVVSGLEAKERIVVRGGVLIND